MANLKQQIEARNKNGIKKAQHQKDISLPEYGEYGQIVRKPIRIPNWLLILSIAIIALWLIIYVPAWVTGGNNTANRYVIYPDSNVIRDANVYLQENPEADFDGDGLSNAYEQQKGTDPRHVDTDRDGLSDGYELLTLGTNPTSENNDLVNYIKMQAAEEGKNVNTPYKVNDVVMWPADWYSRAHGSVVKTVNGFRFCEFKGYAQFPAGYAYRVENGVHIPLNYKQTENAYEITGDYEVLLYDKILPVKYEISLLNNKYYLDDEGSAKVFGKILDIILPAHSPLISCRAITTADINDEPKVLVSMKPQWLSQDYPNERFGRNKVELSDLAQVYAHLNSGQCCLASIFVQNEGEAIVEIYGYNSNGALLLCDPDTLTPIGTLNIVEMVARTMMDDETIIRREVFQFYGCGFDSTRKLSRIDFFNYGTPEEVPEIEEPEVPEIEETPEPTAEPTPEPTEEPTPEPTPVPEDEHTEGGELEGVEGGDASTESAENAEASAAPGA